MVRHGWPPFLAFGIDTGERKARRAGPTPSAQIPILRKKSLLQSIQSVLSALILFFISSPALGRCPLCESISLHPAKNPHFAFFRQLSPLSRPILFIKIGATSYTNCIDHFCSATYIYSFCHTNLRQRLLPANPANEKLRYFLCISANRQSRSNSHSSQNHH